MYTCVPQRTLIFTTDYTSFLKNLSEFTVRNEAESSPK